MAQDNNQNEFEEQDDFDVASQMHEQQAQARKDNIKELARNPHTRPKVIMTAVVLLVVMIMGFLIVKSRGSGSSDNEISSVAKPNIQVSKNITLSSNATENYKQLKIEDDMNKANQAAANGQSHLEIPTVSAPTKQEEVVATGSAPVQPYQPTVAPPPQQAYVRNVAYDKGMENQFTALLEGYAGRAHKVTVVQQDNNTQNPAGGTINVAGANAAAAANPNTTPANDFFIKAGAVYYGTLDLEANSDEPGEILATIQTGPLKGGKAICNFTKGKEALTIRCNTISPPWGNESYTANMMMIDADKNRKDLASDVDHHYIERYGLLLASSFVQGLGQAAGRANSVISTSPLGSTETQGSLNTSDTLLVAAGNAGGAVAQDLQKRSDVATTVRVYAGQSVGLMFLADFKAKSAAASAEKN